MARVVGHLQLVAIRGQDEDPAALTGVAERDGGDVGHEDVDVAFEDDPGQVLVIPQPGLDQGVVGLERFDQGLAVVLQGVGDDTAETAGVVG